MANNKYVHGYSERESDRLIEQADTLANFLHAGTKYPAGDKILEAGCGVGSQTVLLAANSPQAFFTSVDISEISISEAQNRIAQKGFKNVSFLKADIYNLPFEKESFDHIFICFVLEHLSDPENVIHILRDYLKSGGSITVIEGDHGSTYFHPDSEYAKKVIQCLVNIQAEMGGNSLIGRQLFPLLKSAGYRNVKVLPRMIYVDSDKPGLVEGFTRKTFTAMVEGVKKQALERKLVSEPDWERGISDLYRTAEPDGVFCYTFFKAVAFK